MNCSLCGKQLPVIGATNIDNGKICKECAAKIPECVLELSSRWSSYTLEAIVQYEDSVYDNFEETASYGDLHIDTIHGLFAISKKMVDGRPAGRDVFSAFDLTEVGLYAKNPRVDNHMVYVDVEFRFDIQSLGLHITKVIKKKVKCDTKRVDSEHVEWKEPGDMLVFIEMFNTMLSGLWQKMNAMLCGTTVHQLEIEKARALFMLSENYTMDDLKKARNLLMKVYHPDVAEEYGTTEASQIINNYFTLLKNELKLKEKS